MTARGARPGERGAVAVVSALGATALFLTAALAVDIGNTWARRGQLQVQADRAAVFAAEFLPARSDEERTTVAKAAAYYIACHPVVGQRALDPTIPACPSAPEDASLAPYAATLLARSWVTFPNPNQVGVRTPPARVDYGFGRAAGAAGTTQQKEAIARVGSPGILTPMALSLDCLLNPVANATPVGLPFGYVSTTHAAPNSATVTPVTWPTNQRNNPRSLDITPSSVAQNVSPLPTVRVGGRFWPAAAAGESYWVVFDKGGDLLPELAVEVTPDLDDYPNGYAELTLPSSVAASAGSWEVKVATGPSVLGQPIGPTYSRHTAVLDVTPRANLVNQVSCGRLLKSPRGGTQDNINFVLNLQEGLDHLLTTHPSLVTVGGVDDEADLLTAISPLQCTHSTGSVQDTNGVRAGEIPNCVVTNMSNAYEAGFTPGMIGDAGRLTCTTARPCRESFALNGRQINDDEFSDYVTDPGLLNESTFFSASTFLDTQLPVVTPESALKRDLYDSHRFMWVAVISTAGAVSAVQAGDYPVLTFRPIFITQEEGLDLIPDPDGMLTTLDGAFRGILQGTDDQRGLIMDGTELSAVRFLTIEPGALPAVPSNYSGTISEYLGVGPKVIRLVR